MSEFDEGARVRLYGADPEGSKVGTVVLVNRTAVPVRHAVRWDDGTTIPGYSAGELEAAK